MCDGYRFWVPEGLKINDISHFTPSRAIHVWSSLRNTRVSLLITRLLPLQHPTCALDITPTYAVVSSCISFYVPCIVMLGIYCR